MLTRTRQKIADPRVSCTFRAENHLGFTSTPMLARKPVDSGTGLSSGTRLSRTTPESAENCEHPELGGRSRIGSRNSRKLSVGSGTWALRRRQHCWAALNSEVIPELSCLLEGNPFRMRPLCLPLASFDRPLKISELHCAHPANSTCACIRPTPWLRTVAQCLARLESVVSNPGRPSGNNRIPHRVSLTA